MVNFPSTMTMMETTEADEMNMGLKDRKESRMTPKFLTDAMARW